MNAPTTVVLPYIVRDRAARDPDAAFAVFEDGERWSNARALAELRAGALGLRRAGVARGDKVLVWMPNGRAMLRLWFAINALGAVYVAINTAYRGSLLSHVVDNSDARAMFAHPDLVERLADVASLGALRTVYVARPDAVAPAVVERLAARGVAVRAASDLDGPDEPGATIPVDGLMPWDEQSICYTSGTTGPSKGVQSTYRHLHAMGDECLDGIDARDRYLINLPLFHVGGTLCVVGALTRGASIAVLDAFDTKTFLAQSKALGATAYILLGAMAGFLTRQPPSPADRDHLLRRVMVVPLGEDARDMHERFGFTVHTVFNMSETSCPIRSEDNPSTRGSCGRVRPGVQARIVDEHDIEVPPGTPGELVLRTDEPWTLFTAYYKNPAATAAAWRNGWFHTGDMLKVDADGRFFFVDRLKDSIRRRGENVSSFEVESEVVAHPSVLEAAVVGVRSDVSEEEILVAVVPKPGATIDPGALIEFLVERLPHFMVPRYVRVLDALPKTPTAKVEKHVVRSQGVTADAWDREAVGIRLRRQVLRD